MGLPEFTIICPLITEQGIKARELRTAGEALTDNTAEKEPETMFDTAKNAAGRSRQDSIAAAAVRLGEENLNPVGRIYGLLLLWGLQLSLSLQGPLPVQITAAERQPCRG